MGRKLDDLWDYAEHSDKGFKCRFCLKNFTGGVVRLRSHLSGVKGGGIRLCSKVSDEAKNAALSSLNMANKKPKTGPSFSDSDGSSSDICDANCNTEVGYLVANFFFMAGIKHNMVESSSFTSLIKALSPGSALPSSVELESKLISFKTEVEQYVSGAKKSWIETGCTLIPIFELNEKGGRSFLSIFGCSRERIVLLYAIEVPTNLDLVTPFLQQSVHFVVDVVGSHNIVQCVVDASQYGKTFSEFLGSKFPHVYLTKCAAREVQFMFEEICQDVGWVGRTFTIIRSIVDYIWSDPDILVLMRKYTNGKELTPGVNLLSSYKMLEYILEVKEDLVQLVQSPKWLADYGKGQRGIEVTRYIKDPQTWKWGEEVQKGLRSLSQVLCSVDFHDSGSGYLYGLMEIVEHSFSQHWNNNQDMYQRLRDIYMSKKEQILTEFHSVAAFLNPAYMRTEQAKNVDWNPVISTILGRFIAEGDREDFVDEVQEYMKILSDETKLFETIAAKAYHPCQWWEKCVKKQTMLKNLAIKILSQPCSTKTCKSSMRTVEALLVKEQREARAITDLDLKMNAILMERFKKDKACKREKIVLEEFSKQRSDNGELISRPLRQLKLRFQTEIASPIRTSQNVEGENGFRIRVCLVDPSTGRLVQDGIPSMLPLAISVLDSHFSNEASSEEHSTREYFNRNELSGECPYITGDLGVTLIRGEGMLGTFSFNCSSGCTESGKFKLAVKTQTGDCADFRILEGISNAFIVEDAEAEVSTELPMAYVDPQNDSLFGNTDQEWFSNFDSMIQNESDSHLPRFGDANINYQCSGFNQSLAQTAARMVKKNAQMRKLGSRGRGVTFRRESQALGRKRKGKGVIKPRKPAYSSGSNNVNQQEDGEGVNSEPVELEGIDSLSSTSAMTLFGVRVGRSSGAKPVGETNEFALPTHPSNALQLSLTPDRVLEPREVELESAKNVKQQEDGTPREVEEIQLSTGAMQILQLLSEHQRMLRMPQEKIMDETDFFVGEQAKNPRKMLGMPQRNTPLQPKGGIVLAASHARGAPAATDFFVGEISVEVLKLLVSLARRSAFYKGMAEKLRGTLEELSPIVKEIAYSGNELPQNRQQQLYQLSVDINNTRDLCQKLLRSRCWSVYKNLRDMKKLEKIDKKITRFIQTNNMQLHMAADISHTRFGVSEMGVRDQLDGSVRRLESEISQMKIGNGGWVEEAMRQREKESELWQSSSGPIVGVALEMGKTKVREMLIGRDDPIVTIRGIGGSGKTTLAAETCKDPQVRDYFNDRILFLTVSQSPNLGNLKAKIWGFIMGSDGFSSFTPKNLIVLDDVWSLSDLKPLLAQTRAPGCKTLVVLRNHFETVSPVSYEMELLRDHEAVTLFCLHAFDQKSVPPTFDDKLVKQIVNECKGLPLSLKVIGAALRDQPEMYWLNAKNRLSRGEPISEYHGFRLMESMKMSTDHLNKMI